jgi:hypothetical protein
MPEFDRPLDLLYALRDAGVAQPALDTLGARVQTVIQREIDSEVNRPGEHHERVARRRRRPSIGSIVVPLSTVVAVAVAVTAIALLSHQQARQQAAATPQALISRLAVLRRAQTPADVLPAHLHIAERQGTIIPSLTRRVYMANGVRMFLVATQPPLENSGSLWNSRLGDQVSIVAVAGHNATQTAAIPAADLSNAYEMRIVSPLGFAHGGPRDPYEVSVVPNGVAKVEWALANQTLHPTRVVRARASNNLAVARVRPGLLVRAHWYDRRGDVIPTSDRAFLEAQHERNAVQEAQIVRYDQQHPGRAAAAVLAEYAVFAVTSKTGVRATNGDLISRPRLAAIPWEILQGVSNFGASRTGHLAQPDPEETRQVITSSGARVYVIPGPSGVCLYTFEPSPLPEGQFSGGGGSCTVTLSQAASQGVGFTSTRFGVSTTYRLAPKTIRSITVRDPNGQRRTIQLPDGVYVGRTSQRRR